MPIGKILFSMATQDREEAMRSHAIICLVGLVAVACCDKKAEVEPAGKVDPAVLPAPAASDAAPQAAPVEVTLITAEELAGLEAKIMEQVQLNREKKCPRPVLRGEVLPGPADDDIHILLGPDDKTVMECITYIAQSEEIGTWLEKREGQAPDAVAQAQKLCAPLALLIARAVQHGDACSPYLAGRRGHPKLVRLIRLTKAVSLLMERVGKLNRAGRALELGLDTLRLIQDVGRGGASLIAAMVGVAGVQVLVLKGIRPVLNGDNDLSADQLAQLIKETDLLIGAEPDFGSFWNYERVGTALTMILPGLKPEGWEPPGGWDEDYKYDPDANELGKSIDGVSPQQQLGLVLLAADNSFQSLQAACPPGVPPLPCLAGLKQAVRQSGEKATEGKLARTFRTLLSRNPNEEIRAWLLDILQSIATPAFNKYVVRYAHRMFLYVSVRTHLAVRLYRTTTGVCPTASQFESVPELKQAATEPWSNEMMTINDREDGLLAITAPPAYADFKDERTSQEYVIRCKP